MGRTARAPPSGTRTAAFRGTATMCVISWFHWNRSKNCALILTFVLNPAGVGGGIGGVKGKGGEEKGTLLPDESCRPVSCAFKRRAVHCTPCLTCYAAPCPAMQVEFAQAEIRLAEEAGDEEGFEDMP